MSDPSGTDVPPGDGDEVVDLGIPGIEDAVEIGIGGFGRVYRARQPAFGRTVGVKVLAVGKLDEKSQQRFERECQAMGALSGHPNIVTVYDAGTTQDGRPYLIMEYMSGGSYDDRIRRDGGLPWEEAAEVGAKVSAALQVAHDAGIIHRDIKPANVLISPYDQPQLGDFGIARITGGSETRSGVITASMAHASPEVLDGHRPTAAADLYAVGSMVFELIHGGPAFFSATDETNLAMITRIYNDPVPDLRSEGVPEAIAAVVERAMAKKPEDRPQSAAELAEQFREALRQAGDMKGADEAERAAAAGAAAAAGGAAAAAAVVAGMDGPETPGAGVDPSPTAAIPPPAVHPVGPPGAPGGPPAAPPGMPAGAVPFGDVGGAPLPPITGPVPVGGRGGQGGGSKVLLIIALAVVAVLLVIGAVVFFATRDSGGDDPPPPTPSSETTDTTDPVFDPGNNGGGDEVGDPQAPPDIADFQQQGLANNCFNGDFAACDLLFLETEVGSIEEEYGATCGGRVPEGIPNQCEEQLG